MPSDVPPSSLFSAVTWSKGEQPLRQKAAALAGELQLPLVEPDTSDTVDFLLCHTGDGLELQAGGKLKGSLRVDFLSAALTYRRHHGGGVQQALARAVGIKPGIRPSILDATAGLGRDSFLLASLGCPVIMVERSPLLAALLEDALERAGKDPELQKNVLCRLSLLQGNAAEIINGLQSGPDTIYLDPMYPHRRKSALNSLEMRIIRQLVGEDSDVGEVLDAALLKAGKRVVVKRPKGAPLLNEKQPSHAITMKNSRYDVYMVPI